jgi:hypothetical protein
MSRTAVIAGQGVLPARLAAALAERGEPFLLAELQGFPAEVPGRRAEPFRLERLVPFLDHLVAEGVTRVTFAGAVRRPKIEPELFDARTAALFPAILDAFGRGDDAALRALVALFEDWGLTVVGAEEIAPALVPGPGILTGAPGPQDRTDVARAAEIVRALGPLDLGQGAVVAGGLCLAVETLPGTDAMLAFVAGQAQGLRADRDLARGVFYKAPKPGQDRRIDLPVLGPGTVGAAARAGLAGIAWEAGGVLLLDRDAMVAEAAKAGLFLWSRAP